MDIPGFLPRTGLQVLVDCLRDLGYRCIAPQVRDGAILYDTLTDVAQLPWGINQVQAPGSYRLQSTESARGFAWANGPQALKPLTFAPREPLWFARVDTEGRLHFSDASPASAPLAVLGVRACDLAALALQDKHFLQDSTDPFYRQRRQPLLLIAVHCTHSAATCFCASTGDGPAAQSGFDLALHETDDGYFVTAGSDQGRALYRQLPLESVPEAAYTAAQAEVEQAAQHQQRQLPGNNLEQQLFARLDHPQWQQLAERCLSCGNCTQVCPTCFCHSENEVPAVDGVSSEHLRQWDSCFSPGHSYLHGHPLRADTASRYRQWLTHKFGSWHSQYGRSGCVGCGRCLSWCPVGIDPTEELAIICDDENRVDRVESNDG